MTATPAGMTRRQVADTLAMAERVLAEETANRDRRQWAQDVRAWLLQGDAAAGRRAGYQAPQEGAR